MLVNILKMVVLCACVTGVFGLNEFLRRQSPVYGISWVAQSQDYNSTCSKDLRTFLEEVEQSHVWALKALDASGQPRSGFLWGNNLWIGSESECLNIMNRKPLEINHKKVKQFGPTPYDYPPYPLDFVMARMVHNSTLQQHSQMPLERLIQLGLCVPKSCDTEELKILLREYLDSGHFSFQKFYNFTVDIQELNSIWGNSSEWLHLPKTIAFLSIYCLTIMLIIVGTTYDLKVTQPRLKMKKEESNFVKNGIYTIGNGTEITAHHQNHSEKETKPAPYRPCLLGQLCQCFSIYTNLKSFLRTKASYDAIGIVHGFRLLSMFWVISVHSMYFEVDYFENVPDGFRLSEYLITQPFNNSTYCVDSFLFLSGFLLSYLFYKSKKGIIKANRPINITAKVLEYVSYVMNRFLRLTPPYMVCVVTADVLYTWLRQHSVLYASEMVDQVCPKYWWRNLLYINNLFPRSEMCLSWSWYLSADMQFFCIASFILILSTIHFTIASIIVLALVLTGMFTLGVASYSVGYVPTMDEQLITLDAIYDLPWQRIGPYMIGFITGYLLVVKLEWKLNISKRLKTLCWIVFPAINLYIVFGIWGRNLSVEYAAFFMGFSRTFWGIGLGWLFIACCTNNGGIINKILSYKGWLPFSRLTYCAYLINPIIMTMFYGTADSSQHASFSGMIFSNFAMLMATFVFAIWFSMLFEAPYISLTKLILQKSKRDGKTTEDTKS